MDYSPVPLHIPDGFLSVIVAIFYWIPSLVVINLSLRRLGKDLEERQVPLMGVLAATIFAGQMLNFAVAGGTSGHLLGAALAVILLGPWAAVLIMTCVVSVQAVIFQDGGLLALGANLFNMAVVGVFVSYPIFRIIRRFAPEKSWTFLVGGFAAAWASIFISALSVSLQLAFSGVSPANIAIPAMAGVHMLIGVGEGLITVGTLAFLHTVRPDMLIGEGSAARSPRLVWIGGLIISAALIIASPLASADPDGLTRVAMQLGFIDLERQPVFRLFSDYLIPGVSNQTLATILAGVIGGFIVLAAVWFAGHQSHKRKQI